MHNWPLWKSAIRTGFGRQPPLWKERREKVVSAFYYGVLKFGMAHWNMELYDTPASALIKLKPEQTTLLGSEVVYA